MKPLPESSRALVIRTDFSSDAVWRRVRELVAAPVGDMGFLADVAFVDDRAYEDARVDALVPLLVAGRPRRYFAIIADRTTMTEHDHPLLVVDAGDEPGRAFRAVPTAIQSIENNLSLANMDFHEFADSVDPDGVFRDFPA
jgi:hypothetical protein